MTLQDNTSVYPQLNRSVASLRVCLRKFKASGLTGDLKKGIMVARSIGFVSRDKWKLWKALNARDAGEQHVRLRGIVVRKLVR
jgi:hypothetical protein